MLDLLRLALVGMIWHNLASFDIVWHRLSIVWFRLASLCLSDKRPFSNSYVWLPCVCRISVQSQTVTNQKKSYERERLEVIVWFG